MTEYVLKLFFFFFLIKDFSSKDTLFRFIAPSIPKEIYSLNNIDKERICRTERHLSSLKTEISIVNRLTDNDIKKFKQDIETDICFNLPIAFWHRNRHIIQVPCEKNFNRKDTKDRTILTISFNQYEWTDSLTDILSKIMINDILIPFTVILNTHITNVLIKEVLTDSPLLIIKENINCGNFLNKDRFNFLTDRVNHLHGCK